MHLLEPLSFPAQHLSLKSAWICRNPIGLRTGATQTVFLGPAEGTKRRP
jgi:hypothetical protein